MNRYAVIGHPVAHSRSPQIHHAFAAQMGIELRYEVVDITPEALSARLRELHAQHYAGLNVTLPHKTAVAALCRSVSAAARHADAVNTLIRGADGWTGDNTDGSGLIRDLTDNLRFPIDGRRVLLLGAGGAARGVLQPVLGERPAALVLCNRTTVTAEALAQHFPALGPITVCTPERLSARRFDLILNATSAGHRGDAPDLPDGLLADGALAYDLNYGPAARPFLAWAEAQGAAQRADGLGMLVEQAADAFLLWHGVRPDTREVLRILRRGD